MVPARVEVDIVFEITFRASICFVNVCICLCFQCYRCSLFGQNLIDIKVKSYFKLFIEEVNEKYKQILLFFFSFFKSVLVIFSQSLLCTCQVQGYNYCEFLCFCLLFYQGVESFLHL